MVHAFLVIGVIANAWALFGGRYLPFNDWAGHVGLSAVLAHGADTGADAYLTRDLTPSPYLLFYVLTAGWSYLVGAEVGAKLNLLLTTALFVIGAARLLEATGRSPRMAGIAPLALWGLSLGLGFSSFVLVTPMLLFVLADLEWLIGDVRAGRPPWRRVVFVSLGLALAFLGHGLLFVFVAIAVAARLVFALPIAPRRSWRAPLLVALAVVPSVLLAIPSVRLRLDRPYISPEFARPGGPELMAFATDAERWSALPKDLLDRGGQGHDLTLELTFAVFVVWVVASLWRRRALTSYGLEVAALLLLALYWYGPVRIGWPVTFWVVHQRAAIIAFVLVLLLPSVDLSGRLGAGLAALALVPVLHNGAVNRAYIHKESSYASAYDQVRAAIPPKQRVLPLSEGDAIVAAHPFLTSLWPYHFCDGATYLPIGHTPDEVPVHRRNTPSTPYSPQASEFDPPSVGVQYDYLVLRGPRLVRKVEKFGLHTLVGSFDGWNVYRTLAPNPR